MGWMSIIGAVVSAVAGGVKVYGEAQKAKSAEALAKYNAQTLEREKLTKDQEAAMAKKEARGKEIAERRRFLTLKAKQRALYGKAGVQITGTPLTLMAEQAGDMEEDILDIRREGELKSRALTIEGVRKGQMADLFETRARQIRSARNIGITAGILGTAGSAMSSSGGGGGGLLSGGK